MRKLVWLIVLLLSLPGALLADTVELSATREYFLKTGNALFVSREALNPQIAVPEMSQLLPVARLQRSHTDYWVQLNLVNHTTETRWTLDTSNLVAAELTAHVQTGNRHQILQQGFRKSWPFDLRYGMTLDLPPNSIARIWVHVSAPLGGAHPLFSILPAQHYQEKTFSYNTQLLIAIGALVILSIYQLVIFIPTRDWAWFWSALLHLCGALAWAAQTKILLYGLSLGVHAALLYLPLFVACAAVLLFIRIYLKLHHPNPLARLLDGSAIASVLAGMAGLLLPAHLYPLLLQIVIALALLLMLGCTLQRVQAGLAAARFVLAGSILLVLAGFFYMLDKALRLDIIENDILLATRIHVLTLFACMLGLIERANLLQRQRPLPDTRSATDPVTQLPNRSAFERDVRAWEAYCKEGILKDFYLTFFEVTTLRQTNASRGMREGDRLLGLIGLWLQEQSGNHNVYRIGGDEFVVLTQKSIPWDLAPLYKQLQQEGFRDTRISIGCSCLSESTGRSSLLKLADDRLHGISES